MRSWMFMFVAVGMVIGATTARADGVLPTGTSDRFFITDQNGVILGEQDFIEGGAESLPGICPSGCIAGSIALVEADGSISDVFTVDEPDPQGVVHFTWTSDQQEIPLTAPQGAILLAETADPIDITNYIFPANSPVHVFIQSDVETTPEPGTAMMLAIALMGMVLVARRFGSRREAHK